MIDLHTHSTASDGTFAPAALVDLAARVGLTAIALTDHDTVAGIPEASERGKERGVEVVPGIELSATSDAAGQMHLLGYFIDHENAVLTRRLQWLRDRRLDRAQRIMVRLEKLGVPVSCQRVADIASRSSVGRPHIALGLMEAGHVGSMAEAFDRYLKQGAPAYEPSVAFTSREAIELIRFAGGVAVLAHPRTLKMALNELEPCMLQLVRDGLQGIEAYWSKNSPAETRLYHELGVRLGLVLTGGSDFHGSNKPDVQLGRFFLNGLADPGILLESLRSLAHTTEK